MKIIICSKQRDTNVVHIIIVHGNIIDDSKRSKFVQCFYFIICTYHQDLKKNIITYNIITLIISIKSDFKKRVEFNWHSIKLKLRNLPDFSQ